MTHTTSSHRRHARRCLLGLLVACVCSPAWVSAADWMFAPSYFTHPGSPGYRAETAPQSRSAYRRPYIANHPRMAVRGGYRWNNYTIPNGNSYDRTLYQEFFLDVGN